MDIISALPADVGARRAVAAMTGIRAAQAEVGPIVGPMPPQDTAAAVYRAALRRLGHGTATTNLYPSALKAMFKFVAPAAQ